MMMMYETQNTDVDEWGRPFDDETEIEVDEFDEDDEDEE